MFCTLVVEGNPLYGIYDEGAIGAFGIIFGFFVLIICSWKFGVYLFVSFPSPPPGFAHLSVASYSLTSRAL